MIVCVCNGLSDRTCREAACRPDCHGVGCVYRLLGARVRCGRCVPLMQQLHRETKGSCRCGAEAAAPDAAARASR